VDGEKPTTSEPARLFLFFLKRRTVFEVAQVADETFSFDRQLQLLFQKPIAAKITRRKSCWPGPPFSEWHPVRKWETSHTIIDVSESKSVTHRNFFVVSQVVMVPRIRHGWCWRCWWRK
jgi:hypothetical protein